MPRRTWPLVSLVACAALLWGAWQALESGGRKRAGRPVLLRIGASTAGPGAAEPHVRVALTEEPVREVALEVTGPFRVQPVGSSRVIHQGRGLSRGYVRATRQGLSLAGHDLAATRLELIPESEPAVWVNGHTYRGRLRLFRRPGGLVLGVNVVPLESYVASVVDSEMPAAFPQEARRAQAIAARSYALYQVKTAPDESLYDLFAGTRSQKYLGYAYRDESGRLLAGETSSGRDVAQATRGLVLLHQGGLFCTYYCAVCGGSTIDGGQIFDDAAAPLAGTTCTWCQEAKHYRWSATIARADAQRAARELVQPKPPPGARLKSLVMVRPPEAGRLPQFRVEFTAGPAATVNGHQLRQVLAPWGAMSPRFTLEARDDAFLLNGNGHGHGVGMCQWGARGQALEGRSAAQILHHYYRGAVVARFEY